MPASSGGYPYITQRPGRLLTGGCAEPYALTSLDSLALVDGTDFIYDGVVRGQVTAGEKQLCRMINRIIIFPDKKYYDADSGVFGELGARYSGYGFSFNTNGITAGAPGFEDTVTDTFPETVVLDDSFNVYGTATLGDNGFFTYGEETEVAIWSVGDIYDTGPGGYKKISSCGAPYVVEEPDTDENGDPVYDENGDPVTVSVTYQKICYEVHESRAVASPGISAFREGDAVRITGCTVNPGNNTTAIIRGIEGNFLRFDADIFTAGIETGAVVIERWIPSLTCVCECDNRLWGAAGDTIYASALGDPFNFEIFDGVATDSYSVAVGSPGDFTACTGYSSGVLFFKEGCIHKILGTYPAAYSMTTYNVPGVLAGSERSLVTVNEVLYYHGADGVYAYSGGIPSPVSGRLSPRRYSSARAGADGSRYYICMCEGTGAAAVWSLLVYDTQRGIWVREDSTHVVDFTSLDGVLYMLVSGASGGAVYSIGGVSDVSGNVTTGIDWSVTLCPFYEVSERRKCVSRLFIRYSGARPTVAVSYDGGDFGVLSCPVSGEEWGDREKGIMTLSVLPRRCDSFTVKLSGSGQCKILALMREVKLLSSSIN